MRKPLLTLAAVALVASACSGSSFLSVPSQIGLPATDQAHDFLDLLDALGAMEE